MKKSSCNTLAVVTKLPCRQPLLLNPNVMLNQEGSHYDYAQNQFKELDIKDVEYR